MSSAPVTTPPGAPAAGAPAAPPPAAAPEPVAPLGLPQVWHWQARHPRLVDAVLAAAVLAFCVAGPFAHGDHDRSRPPGGALDATSVALLTASAVALVWRRRSPLVVWAVSLVLVAAAVLHGGEPPTVLLLTLVALYTVGALCSLSTALGVTVVTTLVYGVVVTHVDGVFGDRTVTLLAVLGVSAAAGVAVRSQRLAVEAAEARARQAEVTREEEAERRVTDERLRIAQELHDVLAHHISVINVQAGVARHLMEAQPEAARTALGLVRESSRTVLAEMTTVLGLLRTGEDDLATQPAPGTAQVGALVEAVRRAGLQVDVRTSGEPQPLGELADLTAYRVVQESLTNALKHGTGRAALELAHGPGALTVLVRNPVPTGAPPPEEHERTGQRRTGGHGLLGMRERVASVGGELSAGPDGGDFVVRARIPRQGRP